MGKVLELAKALGTTDVLDYGCGKSTLARNLPFTIKQYDPAIEKYKEAPSPADIVVCTDVLEHIEPEFIDNVLEHLAKLTKKKGYFTASTIEAQKVLADGRNAHLLIKPAKWWVDKFREYFEILKSTEENNEVIVFVEPKKDKMDA
jgi:2-polyprenyl-3-methyl-5-hydroxy-6-metoxy-1,4-benzoquinol methylase